MDKNFEDFIKFVGQQHAFLTDTTDQLNACYAVQVLLWSNRILISIDSFECALFKTDFGQHGIDIYVCYSKSLHVLPLRNVVGSYSVVISYHLAHAGH